MDSTYDLVIRGGSVADGRGGAPTEADIAIAGGRIAATGKIAGKGREEIDAKGRLVTPASSTSTRIMTARRRGIRILRRRAGTA